MDTGQSTHMSPEYFPAQFGLYVVAGHGLQSMHVPLEVFPHPKRYLQPLHALHSEHLVYPSPYNPALQTQLASFASTEHSLSNVAFFAHVLHATHVVDPIPVWYVPLAQFRHTDLPVVWAYVPLAHESHAVRPVLFVNDPTAQKTHPVTPSVRSL
jgi:hypothetical protein